MISDHAEEKGALSRIKIPLVWFIILAIALGLMVALMVPATFPDVNITRVSFADTYSKGERIEGLLLKPTDARELPMPAVVFSHGVIADKEIYLSLYRDLARRGFAVLAIDLPGHGGSAGKNDLGGSEYKAVLAAYDWLIANNADIDPSRVAAAGHSLGGVASTQAGLYQSRKKFSAVVAIWCWQSQESAMETVQGSPPRLAWKMWPLLIWSKQYDIRDQSALDARDIISKVSPGKPPNYEVIVGNLDEGITVEQERELVARAAGLEDVQPGETYGSFKDGTACQLVVTHDDHVMEVFSTDVFSAMYNWLCKSFGIRPSGSAAVPLVRFSLWSWIFGLAFLLGLLLLVIIFRLLCRQLSSPVFLMLPGPLYAPQRQKQMAIFSTLYFIVVSAVTLPLALALGIKVLVPFLVGDVVSSIAIVQVVLVLIGLAAGLFVYYGLAGDYASIPWRQKAKNIGLALVPPLGGFGLLLALYALLARFLYLGPGLPFSWGLFILYVVLVTALFWAEGRYFHLFLLPLFGDDPRGKRKAFYIASEAAVRGVGIAFLFLPFIITEPLLIIGRPGFIRMPLLVAAFIISFPAYLILAWINLYFRKNRVSLILPSLAIVLVQAYFLTTLVCTR